MNPIFVLLLFLGAFALWFLSAGLYKFIGGITRHMLDRTKNAVGEDVEQKHIRVSSGISRLNNKTGGQMGNDIDANEMEWIAIFRDGNLDGVICPYCHERGYYNDTFCSYCNHAVKPLSKRRYFK